MHCVGNVCNVSDDVAGAMIRDQIFFYILNLNLNLQMMLQEPGADSSTDGANSADEVFIIVSHIMHSQHH